MSAKPGAIPEHSWACPSKREKRKAQRSEFGRSEEVPRTPQASFWKQNGSRCQPPIQQFKEGQGGRFRSVGPPRLQVPGNVHHCQQVASKAVTCQSVSPDLSRPSPRLPRKWGRGERTENSYASTLGEHMGL